MSPAARDLLREEFSSFPTVRVILMIRQYANILPSICKQEAEGGAID